MCCKPCSCPLISIFPTFIVPFLSHPSVLAFLVPARYRLPGRIMLNERG